MSDSTDTDVPKPQPPLMFGVTIEKDARIWTRDPRLFAEIVIAVVALVAMWFGLRAMGFSLVHKEPEVKWLARPIDINRNAQGNPIGYVVIGVDAKGFAHLGMAPLQGPAASPPPAPMITTPTQAPITQTPITK